MPLNWTSARPCIFFAAHRGSVCLAWADCRTLASVAGYLPCGWHVRSNEVGLTAERLRCQWCDRSQGLQCLVSCPATWRGQSVWDIACGIAPASLHVGDRGPTTHIHSFITRCKTHVYGLVHVNWFNCCMRDLENVWLLGSQNPSSSYDTIWGSFHVITTARTRICFGTVSANNIRYYLHFRKCQYTIPQINKVMLYFVCCNPWKGKEHTVYSTLLCESYGMHAYRFKMLLCHTFVFGDIGLRIKYLKNLRT